MKWLYRIVARLRGCRHRWERMEDIRVLDAWGDTVRWKAVLRCRRCGWVASAGL